MVVVVVVAAVVVIVVVVVVVVVVVTVDLSRNKSWRLKRVNVMLCFHPYFDIRHNLDGRFVSCTLRPHFTPKEIP